MNIVNSKSLYKSITDADETIPLFLNYYWVNAATNGRFHALICRENNKNLAIFIIPLSNKNNAIVLPKLTQYSGLFYLKDFSNEKGIGKQHIIIEKFIEELKAFKKIRLSFHHSILNLLPFIYNGFEVTLRYTYVLNFNSLPISSKLNQRRRNYVVSLQSRINVTFTEDLEWFYEKIKYFFKSRKLTLSYDFKTLEVIYDVLKIQNKCRILVCKDNNDEVCAVGLLIWDEFVAYPLVYSTNPYAGNGYDSFILYKMMELSSKYVSIFDFEGSVVKNVERVYRQMGGLQKPYYVISRNSKALPLKLIKRAVSFLLD